MRNGTFRAQQVFHTVNRFFDGFHSRGFYIGNVNVEFFLKGEDHLVTAWAGLGPALGATAAGVPVDLSGMQGRRDGSGTTLTRQLAHIGPPFRAG